MPGEHYLLECAVATVTFGGGMIMVQNSFSGFGLVCVNATVYDDILCPFVQSEVPKDKV